MLIDFLYGCLMTLLGMIIIIVAVALFLGPIVLAIFAHPAWLLLYFITLPIAGGLSEIL